MRSVVDEWWVFAQTLEDFVIRSLIGFEMEKVCKFLGNMHRFWLFGVFGQKGVLDFVSYMIGLAVC
jgi:hypothetical protein